MVKALYHSNSKVTPKRSLKSLEEVPAVPGEGEFYSYSGITLPVTKEKPKMMRITQNIRIAARSGWTYKQDHGKTRALT